jgi:hypothetical protein
MPLNMQLFQFECEVLHIGRLNISTLILGGLAQLARASALHAEGQRFESVILHKREKQYYYGVASLFLFRYFSTCIK